MLSQMPIPESAVFHEAGSLYLPHEGLLPSVLPTPHTPGITATLGALAGAKTWEVSDLAQPSEARRAAEALIQARYQSIHGAIVARCKPQLYSIREADQAIAGAVGIRCLEESDGLLEQYLDAPIETILSDLGNTAVSREDIIEVGNLAALNIPVAVLLIAFLFDEASRLNRSHAVFTGTHALRLALRRAKVSHHIIQAADPERLGTEKTNWGRYYECDPQVMLVDVVEGLAQIKAHFWIQRSR